MVSVVVESSPALMVLQVRQTALGRVVTSNRQRSWFADAGSQTDALADPHEFSWEFEACSQLPQIGIGNTSPALPALLGRGFALFGGNAI